MTDKKKTLIELLREELSVIEDRATECESLAARFAEEAKQKRALAQNMRATLEGLSGSVRASSPEQSNESSTEIWEEEQSNQNCEVPTRSPKEMQKEEYKGGYIKVAREILAKCPDKMMYIDDLVEEVFDCQTQEEFEKAKTSFMVELNRGVKEKRLERREDSEIYCLIHSSPETEDFSSEETDDMKQERLSPLIDKGVEVA